MIYHAIVKWEGRVISKGNTDEKGLRKLLFLTKGWKVEIVVSDWQEMAKEEDIKTSSTPWLMYKPKKKGRTTVLGDYSKVGRPRTKTI